MIAISTNQITTGLQRQRLECIVRNKILPTENRIQHQQTEAITRIQKRRGLRVMG